MFVFYYYGIYLFFNGGFCVVLNWGDDVCGEFDCVECCRLSWECFFLIIL